MDTEDGFDPTLLKKKKKKKTFDLDAALGLDDGSKKEEAKDESAMDTGVADLEDNLDLESFGKKKKKKKKPFNLVKLEGALPSTKEIEEEGNNAAIEEPEDDINLDDLKDNLDLESFGKKKKKKKKPFILVKLEGALPSTKEIEEEGNNAATEEPEDDINLNDLEDNLDLESFGKKKKKKKNPFNLVKLEGALPSTKEIEEEGNNAATEEPEDDINLDDLKDNLDLESFGKKKKKKKKPFILVKLEGALSSTKEIEEEEDNLDLESFGKKKKKKKKPFNLVKLEGALPSTKEIEEEDILDLESFGKKKKKKKKKKKPFILVKLERVWPSTKEIEEEGNNAATEEPEDDINLDDLEDNLDLESFGKKKKKKKKPFNLVKLEGALPSTKEIEEEGNNAATEEPEDDINLDDLKDILDLESFGKKKKKKKKPFILVKLEGALPSTKEIEEEEDNLDLESFGKKKKKKKKPFNLVKLEGALPSTKEIEEEGNSAATKEPEDDDINFPK
ncbi:DNA ligase 1-like isoform X13 [Eurosta solidaginis]|uniref:DNA ligase 1-like isoform X13 n=1 Tax=Eurosta solidaginis TaxID=178769 RepID=UPI003530A059